MSSPLGFISLVLADAAPPVFQLAGTPAETSAINWWQVLWSAAIILGGLIILATIALAAFRRAEPRDLAFSLLATRLGLLPQDRSTLRELAKSCSVPGASPIGLLLSPMALAQAIHRARASTTTTSPARLAKLEARFAPPARR